MRHDIDAIRSRFMGVDFKVSRRCPQWVGKYPVVANATSWIADDAAAAVFLVDCRYVAVVGGRSKSGRKLWATGDLGSVLSYSSFLEN